MPAHRFGAGSSRLLRRTDTPLRFDSWTLSFQTAGELELEILHAVEFNEMQSLSLSFKPFWLVLLAVAFLIVAPLVLPLVIGIWLPDIAFAPKRTLAEKKLEDGRIFRVNQSWAIVDFNYQTELAHISHRWCYLLQRFGLRRHQVMASADAS